jgi:hypothetical protein
MLDLCLSCNTGNVEVILALGPQPVSNRFLRVPTESLAKFPLEFGGCQQCGLAQLSKPVASSLIKPLHPWLAYNEPESHLDELVSSISHKFELATAARIRGVTYKDDTTLERLRHLGFSDIGRLNPRLDLWIQDPLAGLETIQGALTPPLAEHISATKGRSDLLIVRHLLEHAHAPRMFLEACRVLTAPGGIMIFEVPDARKMLKGGDHCFLWEEHIVYFTPRTLRSFFEHAGLTDIDVHVYEYAMEDSLVAVVKNTSYEPKRASAEFHEIEMLKAFAKNLSIRSSSIRSYLKALNEQGKKIAVFGAGHLSLKFINFYELAPYLNCVIDDNPHKQSLFMSGSELPIVPSKVLESNQIDLCILGLNLESEQKVCAAKHDYLAHGGKFLSAFSSSARSIDIELSHA